MGLVKVSVHLGYETLFDDKVTDIPRTIRAPAKADAWLAVRLVKDTVCHEELCHRFHDLGEGWRIVRLVLWWMVSDLPRLQFWRVNKVHT